MGINKDWGCPRTSKTNTLFVRGQHSVVFADTISTLSQQTFVKQQHPSALATVTFYKDIKALEKNMHSMHQNHLRPNNLPPKHNHLPPSQIAALTSRGRGDDTWWLLIGQMDVQTRQNVMHVCTKRGESKPSYKGVYTIEGYGKGCFYPIWMAAWF